MLHKILMLMLGLALFQEPNMTEGGTPPVAITLVITNIPKAIGSMRVALFNQATGFREEEYAIRKEVFPCTDIRESFTFKDLPPGRYAVAVYHDSNNNGKLDTILFIPTESYGFSNNVMGTFGPPDFEAASFVVETGTKIVPIKLR
jgi:uncharacterized protein (DUF2141 family)